VKKSIWLAGLLLALALLWFYAMSSREPAAPASKVSIEKTEPAAVVASLAPASAIVALNQKDPASNATAALNPAPSTAVPKSFETPELTRRLADAPVVSIGERSWAVLGTRDLSNPNGRQTILVLRDEASGQLDYRQSALRFVLNEGQDYESFIRSRSNATRLFANPLYADIAVDASRIAAEYTALARDPRIAKVMFIPIEVRPVPK
jgi:hypothetical protein